MRATAAAVAGGLRCRSLGSSARRSRTPPLRRGAPAVSPSRIVDDRDDAAPRHLRGRRGVPRVAGQREEPERRRAHEPGDLVEVGREARRSRRRPCEASRVDRDRAAAADVERRRSQPVLPACASTRARLARTSSCARLDGSGQRRDIAPPRLGGRMEQRRRHPFASWSGRRGRGPRRRVVEAVHGVAQLPPDRLERVERLRCSRVGGRSTCRPP